MSYLRRVGAFLYDFLVGDAWELFVGPLVALGVVWGLLQLGLDAVAGVAFVVSVLLVIATHLTAALRGAV